MTYPEFVKELSDRFGEDKGVLMALRAEVGFLRKYLEQLAKTPISNSKKPKKRYSIVDLLLSTPKMVCQ